MPKARRGGHLYHARKLYFNYKYDPVTQKDSDLLGTERINFDPEYEAYFDPRLAVKEVKTLRKDIRIKTIEYFPWPRELKVIDTRPFLPPLEYATGDPRRTRYLQLRAEVLHTAYGASTPEHWGTADQPIILE
ncbi:hypothetical protein EAG_02066 [Camponotus floridanus]|uniref:Uncharacterized protein n=1 Tax=Camponotus floridanus TaxID=104421 RepID=E2AN81_CAMFO|nr:hypothetical protein EAG_02066 [Camponotus floridanus]